VFVLAEFLKTFQPASGPLSPPITVASSSSWIAPLEASPGGQREKKQLSEDAKRLGGEVEAFRQEREELRAAKTALSEEILELRRANLLLLETVKDC
jgi:hypothetical protein